MISDVAQSRSHPPEAGSWLLPTYKLDGSAERERRVLGWRIAIERSGTDKTNRRAKNDFRIVTVLEDRFDLVFRE